MSKILGDRLADGCMGDSTQTVLTTRAPAVLKIVGKGNTSTTLHNKKCKHCQYINESKACEDINPYILDICWAFRDAVGLTNLQFCKLVVYLIYHILMQQKRI